MQAAQASLNAVANNLANGQTPGYHRQSVEQTAQPGGGVQATTVAAPQAGADMTKDVVAQLQAKNQFLANLAVFKTSSALSGTLLDTHS